MDEDYSQSGKSSELKSLDFNVNDINNSEKQTNSCFQDPSNYTQQSFDENSTSSKPRTEDKDKDLITVTSECSPKHGIPQGTEEVALELENGEKQRELSVHSPDNQIVENDSEKLNSNNRALTDTNYIRDVDQEKLAVTESNASNNFNQDDNATSDIGDECEESDENSEEHQPFLSDVYTCSSCGWKPQMDKCLAHRSFQQGFTNGVYQYQGIMPSHVHGYQNYNYSGYTSGQRPVYPVSQPVPSAMNMHYNPATNYVSAAAVSSGNQNFDDQTRIIQSLRRKTFCLGVIVIVLVFSVVTLAILLS